MMNSKNDSELKETVKELLTEELQDLETELTRADWIAIREEAAATLAKSASSGIAGFVPFKSREGQVTNDQINVLRKQDAY